MQRLCLGVQYDGSRYCGWQRQSHSPSVQAPLERALSIIADSDIRVIAAGRTDTGVHATGQVVHFECDVLRDDDSWVLGANANLPEDISVRWARGVAEDFSARFDAVERRYRYLILNTRSRAALFAHRAWVVHEPLDAGMMQVAANALIGEHDFSAFRAAGCQARHPVRTIRQIRVSTFDDVLIVDITANAFLQRMVRNIVGLLVAVGSGRLARDAAAAILASRDRKRSASAAPAHGLYLTQVLYPEHFDLPQPHALDDTLLPLLPLVPLD